MHMLMFSPVQPLQQTEKLNKSKTNEKCNYITIMNLVGKKKSITASFMNLLILVACAVEGVIKHTGEARQFYMYSSFLSQSVSLGFKQLLHLDSDVFLSVSVPMSVSMVVVVVGPVAQLGLWDGVCSLSGLQLALFT